MLPTGHARLTPQPPGLGGGRGGSQAGEGPALLPTPAPNMDPQPQPVDVQGAGQLEISSYFHCWSLLGDFERLVDSPFFTWTTGSAQPGRGGRERSRRWRKQGRWPRLHTSAPCRYREIAEAPR